MGLIDIIPQIQIDNGEGVLLKTHARFPIPIIMITHDPEDVITLAQTVINYERGRVSSIDGSAGRKVLRPAFLAGG